MRDRILRVFVVLGTTILLITEALGQLHLLTRPALSFTWVVLATLLIAFVVRNEPGVPTVKWRPIYVALALMIVWVLGLTGVTAALSPPNTFDALTYHLPRVVYWAQSQTVDFFPTSYLNQISFPPLAEYLMLHTYILAGGDRYVNLVTWAAFCGSIVGVSSIASALGATGRGQWIAAVFCATLPGAILQASGPKNDCLLALWLVCAVYFGLTAAPLFAGLCFGLAVATKGTAYLFGPALLLTIIGVRWLQTRELRWFALTTCAVSAVLVLNAPLYFRNFHLSGSPLGFASPFADGTFVPKNASPGGEAMLSNMLRHGSDQLGARSERWNHAVYNTVVQLHHRLGIDPQNADFTWQDSRYGPPQNTRHEANANNRWHLVVLCAVFLIGLAIARQKHTLLLWSAYGLGVWIAFLTFCYYLRWQPYGARLLVPLFMVAAPLAGLGLDRLRPHILSLAVCLFLVDIARLPLLENWTRPLRGPGSIFSTSRESRYFADIQSMQNQQSYLTAVDLVVQSRCRTVGIDISKNQLEYPFQALTLQRDPHVRFHHSGVQNPSSRYGTRPQVPRSPRMTVAPRPSECAVLCLNCSGDESKQHLYESVGQAAEVGNFLLFLRLH